MIELTLAGLKTHLRPATATLARLPKSAILLLHGFGAPGDDLVSLSDELDLPQDTWLVFPEGPIDLSEHLGPICAGKRGWWLTDSIQLQLAMLTGQPQLAAQAAGHLRETARATFAAFLDALQAELRIGPERIVLGGFSQGAILSLDYLLHDDRPWPGLLFLSGTLVDVDELRECATRRAGMHVLISHGKLDPILPFALARQLHEELSRAAWDTHFVPYEGSHGIPPDALRAIGTLTSQWLASSTPESLRANMDPT
jgi:phospholipase/carboxylesterase